MSRKLKWHALLQVAWEIEKNFWLRDDQNWKVCFFSVGDIFCQWYQLWKMPENWFENCNFCFVDCLKIAHLFSCNCNIKITKIVTVGNTVSTFKSFGSFLWDKKEESAWKNANSFWPFRQFVVPLVKAERLFDFSYQNSLIFSENGFCAELTTTLLSNN